MPRFNRSKKIVGNNRKTRTTRKTRNTRKTKNTKNSKIKKNKNNSKSKKSNRNQRGGQSGDENSSNNNNNTKSVAAGLGGLSVQSNSVAGTGGQANKQLFRGDYTNALKQYKFTKFKFTLIVHQLDTSKENAGCITNITSNLYDDELIKDIINEIKKSNLLNRDNCLVSDIVLPENNNIPISDIMEDTKDVEVILLKTSIQKNSSSDPIESKAILIITRKHTKADRKISHILENYYSNKDSNEKIKVKFADLVEYLMNISKDIDFNFEGLQSKKVAIKDEDRKAAARIAAEKAEADRIAAEEEARRVGAANLERRKKERANAKRKRNTKLYSPSEINMLERQLQDVTINRNNFLKKVEAEKQRVRAEEEARREHNAVLAEMESAAKKKSRKSRFTVT